MTVLVGVLCQDGIVVGGDSSATFAAGNQRTVEQPVKKIEVIDGRIVVAGTGAVGLGQRFVEIVRKNHKVFESSSPIEAAKHICREAITDFQSTGAQPAYGALVAFPHHGKLHLVEFETGSLQPEFKTDGMWYVSMGSGQPIADPFLGLMRRTLCPDGPPRLSTGKFMAAWTLAHTCDVNPGGVKEPVALAVVTTGKQGPSACLLDDQEMDEHNEMVVQAESYLAGFPGWLASKTPTDVPDVTV